jgi:hypothetical protein
MPHFITNTVEELVLDIIIEPEPVDLSGRFASCPPTGCWGHRLKRGQWGYRQAKVGRKHNKLHRLIYEHLRGPIPEGLVLDHLCRNTGCCNPDHLEPVTNSENASRGGRPRPKPTHCPRGHAYLPDNFCVNGNGTLYCRRCHREKTARRRALYGR